MLCKYLPFALASFSICASGQNLSNFILTTRDQIICTDTEDFNAIAAQDYTILTGSGLSLGERYIGNEIEATQFGDLITGEATNPLTLLVGLQGQSLRVVPSAALTGKPSTSMSICGVAGNTATSPLGNGALSIIFDVPQTEVAFDVYLLGSTQGLIEIDLKAVTGELVQHFSYDSVNPIPSSLAYTRIADADPRVAFSGLQIYTALGSGICIDYIQYCAPTAMQLPSLTGSVTMSPVRHPSPNTMGGQHLAPLPSSFPVAFPTHKRYPIVNQENIVNQGNHQITREKGKRENNNARYVYFHW